MKTRFWLILMSIFIMACGCNLPFLSTLFASKPKIINHPRPNLSVDSTPFTQAGCENVYEGIYNCAEDHPLFKFGCQVMYIPDPMIGGLQPSYPLVECQHRVPFEQEATEKFLWDNGCAATQAVTYVIQQGDTFRALQSLEDMQAVFAPIDSPEEALSYAITATGFYSLYDQKVNNQMRYATSSLEDTHVDETSDGYIVNLYTQRICGCGNHPIYVVNVEVTRDGRLVIGERSEVFADPKQDGMCVD
jgi:hypothetical protein